MTGAEIISYLSNIPTVQTAVTAIVGGLITAIFLRHNTETEEFAKIKAGHFKQVIDDLLKSGKMTYSEYYKSKNLLSIASKADEYYSSIPHKDDKRAYDFDWYMRFYEAVGTVSDEAMQTLWAKILAGEINIPKSYSLRTITALHNMTKSDAELFEKVVSCCVMSSPWFYLPYYEEYLEMNGITYYNVMSLSELGLINSDGTVAMEPQIDEMYRIITMNDHLAIQAKSRSNKSTKLSIGAYPLTAAGRQIARNVGYSLSDVKLLSFAKELRNDFQIKMLAEIKVCKYTKVGESNYQFDTKNILDDE